MTNKIKVAVASRNPVKINAARVAFEEMFEQNIEIISIDAPSGVSDQPMDYPETKLGAQTRVKHAQAQVKADYYVAYEGGVDVFDDGPKTFAIVCVSNGRHLTIGQTATLPLPRNIYNCLLAGQELGTAMDELFNTFNIKQKGGAIGQLTGGKETRTSVYKSATILLLSRFINPEIYE